jgi:ABC-type transporter Mla subunit MlaD
MLSDLHDPTRLLVGIAQSTRRAAKAVEDPYARRQLHATVDVLLRISSSLAWSTDALREDRAGLEAVLRTLPDHGEAMAGIREDLLNQIEHGIQRMVSESESPNDEAVAAVSAVLGEMVEAELRLTQTGTYYEEK